MGRRQSRDRSRSSTGWQSGGSAPAAAHGLQAEEKHRHFSITFSSSCNDRQTPWKSLNVQRLPAAEAGRHRQAGLRLEQAVAKRISGSTHNSCSVPRPAAVNFSLLMSETSCWVMAASFQRWYFLHSSHFSTAG